MITTMTYFPPKKANIMVQVGMEGSIAATPLTKMENFLG